MINMSFILPPCFGFYSAIFPAKPTGEAGQGPACPAFTGATPGSNYSVL